MSGDRPGGMNLAAPRTGPRQPGDFVGGCGIPADGQTSGKSCAGVGTQLSCQLCPESPTYWRRTDTTNLAGCETSERL